MPLIKNQTTTITTSGTATVTAITNITDKTATTQSTHKPKQKANTANKTATNGTVKTANAAKNANNTNNQRHKQKQQKSNNDATKRKKHCYTNGSSNKHRKHKTTLAKSVPATPVQVNPFVPSSPDLYDDDDDDDDVLYMPPYSYPNCSLDILNGDYQFDNVLDFKAAQEQDPDNDQLGEEEEHFRSTFNENHTMQFQRGMEGDSSSMAMITPPPPYDTPYSKQLHEYSYNSPQRYTQHQAAYTGPKAQRSHNTPHTRKYIFNNNREQFNISSSNGNSSSNSIQQQVQSTSLGSTLTNAITPTKLSAAAAAMFAAPQMVQLNRKWSNLHRKRRRRNSSSGDSKELDKLVLQSVDWDENDIY